MIIWASDNQFFKDGKRISKALFSEILIRAEHRAEAEEFRHIPKRYKISGMTANVYRFEDKAWRVDWAEMLLRAGEPDEQYLKFHPGQWQQEMILCQDMIETGGPWFNNFQPY
jgi:hypothetical protein